STSPLSPYTALFRSGLDFERAPGLGGVIPLKLKPLAETLLRTHVGDPLLVRGRRGLGRTAAFASDAGPRWAHRWIGWEGFPKFRSEEHTSELQSREN